VDHIDFRAALLSCATVPVVDPSVTEGRLTTGAVITDDAGRVRCDKRRFRAVGVAFALRARPRPSPAHRLGRTLKAVSSYLRAEIRHEDLAFRYGGEEFLIVLPWASLDGIQGRIERMHAGARDVQIEKVNRQIWPITISAVAMFLEDGRAADDVIRVADSAF